MIVRTLFLAWLVVFSITLFSACGLLDQQGPVPAYIHIPSLSFQHDADEGPVSHEIDHVEVFFENFSIGFYEIPVTIPVIPTAEISNLVIKPAIRLNGKQNAITPYAMMNWYEVDQKFELEESYTITPVFTYGDNIVFDYVETFEAGNSLTFNQDEIDSTSLVRTELEAKDGNFSGLLTTANGTFIEVATEFVFTDLDNEGRDVFLELDYKNDINLTFGMVLFRSGQPEFAGSLVTFPPRTEWNKFYLDLTNVIVQTKADGYRLYFSIESNTSSSEVYVDNIKLLHAP